MKIEESENASSHQESNPGPLAWAASALPLSHDSQTTTNPHNPLYVLHRWYWMLQSHTWQPQSVAARYVTSAAGGYFCLTTSKFLWVFVEKWEDRNVMFIPSRERLAMRLHRGRSRDWRREGGQRVEIGGHVYSAQLAVDVVHCIAGGLGSCSPRNILNLWECFWGHQRPP